MRDPSRWLVLNDFQSRWLPVSRDEITNLIDVDEIFAIGAQTRRIECEVEIGRSEEKATLSSVRVRTASEKKWPLRIEVETREICFAGQSCRDTKSLCDIERRCINEFCFILPETSNMNRRISRKNISTSFTRDVYFFYLWKAPVHKKILILQFFDLATKISEALNWCSLVARKRD